MKHILMLATGGTIASKDSGQGLTPEITSEEILGYVPPQFVIDTYTRRALRFKEKDFQQIFEIFTKWHNGIMSGRKEMDIQALIQLKAIL